MSTASLFFSLHLLYIKGKGKIRTCIMPAFMILAFIDLSYNAYVSVNAYFPDKENDSSITIQAFKDFVDETTAITDHISG